MIEVKQLSLPPRMTNHDGKPRRIGIEIEFSALTAEAGAQVIRDVFGGTVVREDIHRYFVRGTEFGDFTCELDLQYVHRADGAPEAPESSSAAPLDVFLHNFRETLRGVYGDVSALVVPCEIVCPPVAIADLPKLEAIIDALRVAGAADTRASPLYGFGAHLNPEIANGGLDWIVDMLKSYLLLSEWLRAVMRIDLTRRLIAFTNPFPAAYVAKVVDPGYRPDQSQLIDDYIAYNPTRNRELDMLPLFAWLDGPRVNASVRDRRIGSRPTFHYRLPDANFGQSTWGLMLEWNRWCVVERLAERPDLIARMGRAYCDSQSQIFADNWALQASEWIMVS